MLSFGSRVSSLHRRSQTRPVTTHGPNFAHPFFTLPASVSASVHHSFPSVSRFVRCEFLHGCHAARKLQASGNHLSNSVPASFSLHFDSCNLQIHSQQSISATTSSVLRPNHFQSSNISRFHSLLQQTVRSSWCIRHPSRPLFQRTPLLQRPFIHQRVMSSSEDDKPLISKPRTNGLNGGKLNLHDSKFKWWVDCFQHLTRLCQLPPLPPK